MNESVHAEKLAHFKQNEKPEAVLVVADNPELIRIVVAWTNIEVSHAEKPTNIAGESDTEIWKWLWDNISFSMSELRAKTGVAYSESVLEGKMLPLIGNRILYPDGTVNSFVQRYLRERVLRHFETKPERSRKTAS